jgi:hypothetical protein
MGIADCKHLPHLRDATSRGIKPAPVRVGIEVADKSRLRGRIRLRYQPTFCLLTARSETDYPFSRRFRRHPHHRRLGPSRSAAGSPSIKMLLAAPNVVQSRSLVLRILLRISFPPPRAENIGLFGLYGVVNGAWKDPSDVGASLG